MAQGICGRDEPLLKFRRNSETAEGKVAAVVQRNIHSLPDEIMVNIFSSLSFNDLIDTVENVCERWKRLAHDSVLWLDKEYVVTGMLHRKSCCRDVCSKCIHRRWEETDEDILRTAGMTPQLRTLKLMCNIRACILRKICAEWPNLTTLEIADNQRMNYSLLKFIFEKCPKIRTLTASVSLLANRRYVEMLSSLEQLSCLRVHEHFCKERPIQLRVLADTCPRLEAIHIQRTCYEVADMEYFLKTKKHSLTSATLPWLMVENEELRCIVPLLKQCDTSLRKLRLANFDMPVYMPANMEAAVFQSLGELHSLLELYAPGVNPHSSRMFSLVFRPGCLTQLRRLQLQYAFNLRNETVVTISQGCPNLRELRLKDSREITDLALREIHRLKYLEILELSGCNGLGASAIFHIAQLPSLHTLVLQEIEDLTELLPSLRHIVDIKELQCLDFLKSCNFEAVPIWEFPGRLLKLRELHVTYEDEKVLTELQHKMPRLKVINTFGLKYEYSSDEQLDDDDDGVLEG
ncbi:uncharacterized protein LOC126293185 [Schistocerca gregaria]|uniref:uncharacterized protein LOC126293185 n=1 Tax=Schistocerca gregaria TaxID=7010 RepID=UPI00211E223E|nr:uncharacterized protein LOC126293185 [Schistocerca gregaria]